MNQKYFHSFIAVLTIGLLAFLIYSTYSTNTRLSNLETSLKQIFASFNKPITPSPTSIQKLNPSFDRNQVSPGDRVGSMTVVLPADRSVQFSGKIIITGNYSVSDGQGMMEAGIVCFDDIDQSSLEKFPQEIKDDRKIWFCLNNNSKLKTLFTKSTGTATIEIDNYLINLIEGSVYNTADLVKLISLN